MAKHKNEDAAPQIPSGFRMDGSGVYAIGAGQDGAELWLCSPLIVKASSRSELNEDWGQLLSFCDRDGNPHEWLMRMSMLSGDGSQYRKRLLDLGLQIASGREERSLLSKYIQTANPDVRIRSVTKVGWHGDVYVLPDEVIGGIDGEEVQLQSWSGPSRVPDVSGSLEDWKNEIGRFCPKNSRLIFAVSIALAGPVFKIVDEQGGGFHFRGATSSGKTTALWVAGSVWGRDYVSSWRTTSNGFEAIAANHSDGFLALDELGQANPQEAGEIAYALANGSGKQRMGASATAAPRLEWRLSLLSSGEMSLAEHAEAAGKRVRGGQKVRLCDLDADAGAGLGAFEIEPATGPSFRRVRGL